MGKALISRGSLGSRRSSLLAKDLSGPIVDTLELFLVTLSNSNAKRPLKACLILARNAETARSSRPGDWGGPTADNLDLLLAHGS